jgi:hypothetical protein
MGFILSNLKYDFLLFVRLFGFINFYAIPEAPSSISMNISSPEEILE